MTVRDPAGAEPASPPGHATRVGVVVPHDMVLDGELWRWAPDGVSLLFTRTPFVPLPVTARLVERLADPRLLASGAADLSAAEPHALVYACTSGSFAAGLDGEARLVAALRSAGSPVAVTTSGAVAAALTHLGAVRVAVATPYDAEITAMLAAFLAARGVTVVGSEHLGLTSGIWGVGYDTTRDLVRRADRPGADAVVVSCTNLPTYDVVADLEAELGKPVVTANQATMWAVLRELGLPAVGPGQGLLEGWLSAPPRDP